MRSLSFLQRIRKFYGIEDPTLRDRGQSADYQRRLRWIQFGWILAGVAMLVIGSNAAAVGIGLCMTFLSFALIDDS